jgi:hypothetical protein
MPVDKIKNTHDSGEAEVKKVTGAHKRPKDKNVGDKNVDASAAEKVSVMPSGAVRKEDLDILFDGSELSEDFQSKAFTLFEGAISAKVEEIKESLESEYEEKLVESVSSYEDKLSDFLDIFVENYMTENELAIENGIKAEIAESLIDGLKTLFNENNIEVEEDKVDIVETLSQRVAELETDLNESLEAQREKENLIESFEKNKILDEMLEDLDDVSKEKVRKLTENMSFNGSEGFTESVNILKESVTTKVSAQVKEDMLNEAVNIKEGTDAVVLDPKMTSIINALRSNTQ